jgi:hypothetical protein
MKVLAILLVVAGLVIAIAPQFTNCEAKGGTMPMATAASAGTAGVAAAPASSTTTMVAMTTSTPAKAVPKMKCLWTARGAIAVGVTMVVVGGLLFVSRRKETRRALGILAALLGVFTILLPEALIGTCASDAAVCNTTMTPIMLAAGGIATVVGIAVVIVNEMRREMPLSAEAAT